jgi:hypothetical protein
LALDSHRHFFLLMAQAAASAKQPAPSPRKRKNSESGQAPTGKRAKGEPANRKPAQQARPAPFTRAGELEAAGAKKAGKSGFNWSTNPGPVRGGCGVVQQNLTRFPIPIPIPINTAAGKQKRKAPSGEDKEEARLDDLVAKYRTRLIGRDDVRESRSRWFE